MYIKNSNDLKTSYHCGDHALIGTSGNCCSCCFLSMENTQKGQPIVSKDEPFPRYWSTMKNGGAIGNSCRCSSNSSTMDWKFILVKECPQVNRISPSAGNCCDQKRVLLLLASRKKCKFVSLVDMPVVLPVARLRITSLHNLSLSSRDVCDAVSEDTTPPTGKFFITLPMTFSWKLVEKDTSLLQNKD